VTKLTLTTELTPKSLQIINDNIEKSLDSDDIDDERVLQLMVERDTLIQELISEWADNDTLKLFAEQEISINEMLLKHMRVMRQEVEQSLGKLVRGRKAIKKYHG
jgi:hypothetical protein